MNRPDATQPDLRGEAADSQDVRAARAIDGRLIPDAARWDRTHDLRIKGISICRAITVIQGALVRLSAVRQVNCLSSGTYSATRLRAKPLDRSLDSGIG